MKPVSLTTLAEGAATYDLPSLTAVIVLVDASNETVAPSLAAASLISAMIADFWSAVREAISFTPLAVAVAASILAIT